MKFFQKLFVAVLLTTLFTVSFWGIFTILFNNFANSNQLQKKSHNNGMFPILIVGTEDKLDAQIFYKEDLTGALDSKNSFSYLVPSGSIEKIRRSIHNKYPDSSLDRQGVHWGADLQVRQISSDRQLIKVWFSRDDWQNFGEYEATDKMIYPKYHKCVFVPGLIIKVFPMALLVNVLLWWGGIKIYFKKLTNSNHNFRKTF